MSENYGKAQIDPKYRRKVQFRNQPCSPCQLQAVTQCLPACSTHDIDRFPFFFADFLFKFLVIGSAGTGKSCILHQFIEGKCE